MGDDEEIQRMMEERYRTEQRRRAQADRVERLGLTRLALQLHMWNQYQLSPKDLDHGRTGIDD